MKYIEIRFCPLKGLIIMNFNDLFQFVKWEDEEPFPSPTGVTYYELQLVFIPDAETLTNVSVPTRG